MNRRERILRLVRHLAYRGPQKLDAICRMLEVSERTGYRLINDLREAKLLVIVAASDRQPDRKYGITLRPG